jgi:prepilin-type N-terminal cleavage/methylation domain-containing protein
VEKKSMKSGTVKHGFTVIEIIVTVAIIVIFIAIIAGIARRVENQNRARLCRTELALIDNALERFRDFGYEYKGIYSGLGFTFPLDCNDDADNKGILITTLQVELAPSAVSLSPNHDANDSGSEGLYFYLSQVPDCRTTIDKIDKTLVTNLDKSRNPIMITIGTNTIPLMRFIDPWGTTLNYDYYDEFGVPFGSLAATKKTFPVITSAGPDKQFGTDDDIFNRQGK